MKAESSGAASDLKGYVTGAVTEWPSEMRATLMFPSNP